MTASPMPLAPADATDGAPRTVLRHRWPLRLMHWINAACLLVLMGSGLQVLNAHPALYWGEVSHFDTPLASARGVTRDGALRGITRIGGWSADTTGWLGVSDNARGVPTRSVVPGWAMIPSSRDLALGRRWHFFFGWLWVLNGVAYLGWSLATRHLQRDLALQREDWRAIPRSVVDHLRLRHPVGEAALRYNPLQKLAYLGVALLLAPLLVLTGLAMSPQVDTVLVWFLDLVGGRQSARTLHFLAMLALLAFFVVHVAMVVQGGLVNGLRSMVTGRYRVRGGAVPDGRVDGGSR